MDWGTLAATISGAVIAICGTVLADRLRTRHDDDRGLQGRQREAYIEFITAAGAAHAQLRHLAQYPGAAADLEAASRAALADARLYEARERLFIDASAAVAGPGQAMFERLRGLRRTVAAGALVSSPAFHAAYHPYIEAVWGYRTAVRRELDGGSLSPAVFGWAEWDGTDRCPLCRPGLDAAAADSRPAITSTDATSSPA